MKLNSQNKLIAAVAVFITVVFLSGSVQAEKTGNGGVSHVCRDAKTKKITSIEMLDIRRGRLELKLQYRPIPQTEKYSELKWYARAFNRMAEHKGPYQYIHENLEGFFLGSKFEATPWYNLESGDLFWTGDGDPGQADPGCQFEQVAVFLEGKLYVQSQLFQAMDKLNQTALYLHESIYQAAKLKAGAKSSIESQKLVALLLSENATATQISHQVLSTLPGLIQDSNSPAWLGTDSRNGPLYSQSGALVLLNQDSVRLKLNIVADEFTPYGEQSFFLSQCTVELITRKIKKDTGLLDMDVNYQRFPLYFIDAIFSPAPLNSRFVTAEIDIPFMPSGIFYHGEVAGLGIRNCHGASVSVEVFQDGQILGSWKKYIKAEYITEDGYFERIVNFRNDPEDHRVFRFINGINF